MDQMSREEVSPMTEEEGILYARQIAAGWSRRSGMKVDGTDYLSDALYAYVIAAQNFDPTKGRTFRSYLYINVNHFIRKSWKNRMTHQKRYQTGEPVKVLVVDQSCDEASKITSLMAVLDAQPKKVCEAIMDGESYRDIGKKLSLSRQMIGVIMKKIRGGIYQINGWLISCKNKDTGLKGVIIEFSSRSGLPIVRPDGSMVEMTWALEKLTEITYRKFEVRLQTTSSPGLWVWTHVSYDGSPDAKTKHLFGSSRFLRDIPIDIDRFIENWDL